MEAGRSREARKMTTTTTWWVVLTSGSERDMPPRGPWSSREAATLAIQRWRERVGHAAGTILAARSARLVPFGSRARARAADIGDYSMASGPSIEVS